MNCVKEFIKRSESPFLLQLKQSIKIIEIEETMDLLIHRPIGLWITWLAIRLKISPTQVSLLSMVTGVAAGILFFWQDRIELVLWGCFFLILSGILDTVDGQVARLTNQSSHLGMVLDGFIDNVVFTAVYAGCFFYNFPEFGFLGMLVTAISGFCHSSQSMIFDYYKNEFSFLYGDKTHYRNPTPVELRDTPKENHGFWSKFLSWCYTDYIQKQSWMTNRKGNVKKAFEDLHSNPEIKSEFQSEYKKTYLPYMTFWALFGGTNTHRTMIMISCIFNRFDLYILINLGLSLPIILLGWLQAKTDTKFLARFAAKLNHSGS